MYNAGLVRAGDGEDPLGQFKLYCQQLLLLCLDPQADGRDDPDTAQLFRAANSMRLSSEAVASMQWVSCEAASGTKTRLKTMPGLEVSLAAVYEVGDSDSLLLRQGLDYADFEDDTVSAPAPGHRCKLVGSKRHQVVDSEGRCGLCLQNRAHTLYQVILSTSPHSKGGHQTFQTEMGGSCLERAVLYHGLCHFEGRLKAALLHQLKAAVRQHGGDLSASQVAVLQNAGFINKLWGCYKQLKWASENFQVKQRMKERNPVHHAVMQTMKRLHPDPQGYESDLALTP
ncbi:hypothetical protein HaLaN_00132, partial [Haematococcus lacustris]